MSIQIVVSILGLALAFWLTWRGVRRGAVETLRRWLPGLGAFSALVLFSWLACRFSESFRLFFVSGCIVAVVAYVSARILLRRRVRGAASAEEPNAAPRRSWLHRIDQVAGGFLGLAQAAIYAVLVTLALSSTLYAYTVWGPDNETAAVEEKPMTKALRQTCLSIADAADVKVLAHVPAIARGGQEMRALVHVLNAPKEELHRLADEFEFRDMMHLPEVSAALADKEYVARIERFGEGRLHLLGRIAEDPHTRKLLDCPEFQARLEDGLTPSKLYAKLRELRSGDAEGAVEEGL